LILKKTCNNSFEVGLLKLKLSTCIIHTGEKQDLWACVSKVKGATDELIVVHSGTTPKTDDSGLSLDIPLSFVADKGNLQETAGAAVQKARGEWVLIIKSGENLTPQSAEGLGNLTRKGKESAFAVTCQRQADSIGFVNGMGRYEWIGNRRKFQTSGVRRYNVVSSLEVRLFKRKWFEQLLMHADGSLVPVFCKELTTIPISSIRIEQPFTPNGSLAEATEEQKFLQDYRQFVDDPEEDLSRYEGLESLAPGYIGYKILDETNYPSLIAGLEMGWGHVDILKDWLVVQILHGDYDNAIQYAAVITSTLGDHFEIWRLKGDASFLQLDLKNAEACYRKALSLKKDYLQVLSNLAKVCLFRGKYDEAKKMFLVLKDSEMQSQEIDFIINSLNEKSDHRVKLSLLMLCKDEEEYIARALESVRDVVDEMIVVDTGSRDRTRSIARKLGAKVIKQSWNDHFSEARNAGLAHVTGDYVLWMDADEFINRKDQIPLLVLKSILSVKKPTGITFRIETFKEEQNTPNPLPPEKVTNRTAIFPHLPGIHFSGRIFESVDDSLDALGVVRFIAENSRFLHISENTGLRNERKRGAIEKCTKEPLGPESLFKGTLYWLNLGDFKKTEEWFERAVSEIQISPGNDKIIGLLANALAQKGCLKVNSPTFKTLLTEYRNSYQIMSLCAKMLYQAGLYVNAAAIFEKISFDEDNSSQFQLDKRTRLNNLFHLAATNLESDNFEKCDKIFSELASEEDMYDTLQALLLYSEIRKRDIENGIAILDSWIRIRKLPIKATINSFVDLTNIIVRVAEIMTGYGKGDAANMLKRSCQHLIETLHMKEQVNS